MEMSSSTSPIPEEVLPWAVGENIAELCAGVPTYWLHEEGSELLPNLITGIINRKSKIPQIQVHIDQYFTSTAALGIML